MFQGFLSCFVALSSIFSTGLRLFSKCANTSTSTVYLNLWNWMFVYLLMLLQLEPLRRKSFFRFYGDSRGAREESRISIFAHLQFYAFKGLFLSYAFWKYLISKEANLTSWLSWHHCVEQKCRSWCQVGCVCVRLFTDFLKLLGLRACHCQYNISIGRVGGALK